MTEHDHDPKVTQRYRELPAEEPPRALDEAILAASRRAVEAHPAPLVAPTGRWRWYVPLAAAAVIVLAVAVTWHVQLEQPEVDGVTPQPESRVPAREKVEPKVEAKAERRIEQPVKRQAKPVEAPKPFVVESALPPAPASGPAPASAPAPAAAKSMAASRASPFAEREDLGRARAERAAPLQLSAKRTDIAKAAAEAESPERALDRIAELRKAGKHDEADKALADFRKRYPDYKIPEPMRERVERR